MERRKFFALVGGTLLASLPARAFAVNDYPNRPVRIICPFAPGGSGDITSRIFAEYFRATAGQAMVVENRAGANGSVGAAVVKGSAPDGYTLLLSTNSVAIANGLLFRSLPYDYEKDFKTVGVFGKIGMYMLVRSDHPAKSLSDFIAYAKEKPKQLFSSHFNTSSRIAAAIFGARAGIQLVEVPYKDVGQAVNDLIGGRIDIMFMDTIAADAHVESGTMRALAVTTETRSKKLPDVPALAEHFTGFEFFAFLSLSTPKETPLELQQRLNQLVNDAIETGSIRVRLEAMGQVTQAMSLELVDQFIRRERERWTDYIKQAGIEPQ
jgi:tripartite-type tricarboxylate transporter receptor subunit TctC